MGMTGGDSQDMTLVMLVSAAFDASVRALHERLPELGFPDIRPVHCTNVFRVIDAEGTRPSELARRAGVTPQSMAEFVRYLETGGYLERRPAPDDGRGRVVTLTERGRAASGAARQAFTELEQRWAQAIGHDQLTEVRAALATMGVHRTRDQ
jgi:DNA-binding MarR family transcriptional regulator